MITVANCSKCKRVIKLDSEEEPDYSDENYFYKEWVYLNNKLMCKKCFYDKFFEGLKFNY